jgi:predicted methyltransferase MtxX (methanogen marker protein 4)
MPPDNVDCTPPAALGSLDSMRRAQVPNLVAAVTDCKVGQSYKGGVFAVTEKILGEYCFTQKNDEERVLCEKTYELRISARVRSSLESQVGVLLDKIGVEHSESSIHKKSLRSTVGLALLCCRS